jgi:hypothetical protein
MENFQSSVTRADFAAMVVPLIEKVVNTIKPDNVSVSDTKDPNLLKCLKMNIFQLTDNKILPSTIISTQDAAILFNKIAIAIDYKGSTENFVPSGTFTRENCLVAVTKLFEFICDK